MTAISAGRIGGGGWIVGADGAGFGFTGSVFRVIVSAAMRRNYLGYYSQPPNPCSAPATP